MIILTEELNLIYNELVHGVLLEEVLTNNRKNWWFSLLEKEPSVTKGVAFKAILADRSMNFNTDAEYRDYYELSVEEMTSLMTEAEAGAGV